MHKQRFRVTGLVLVCGLAMSLAGCPSSSDKSSEMDGGASGSATESPNLGEMTSLKVTAADGGTVALTKAGVKLAIPGGALDGDTTITAEVVSNAKLPDSSSLAGDAVEFLPKGTTFKKPVSLSIDLGKTTVPTGSSAKLSWLDEKTNKWVDLDGAKVVGGAVVANTTHFTIFMIRIVVDAAGNAMQTGGGCSGTYKACGGDIAGTWTITKGCANVPQALSDQVTASCKGATFEFGLDIAGDITFASGKVTGTLNVDSVTTQTMPKTCTGGMCSKNDPSKPNETITDTGTACEDKKTDSSTQMVDGTYVVDATAKTLTIMNKNDSPDAGAPKADDYCVTGNTLTVLSHEDNGVDVQWTATRK